MKGMRKKAVIEAVGSFYHLLLKSQVNLNEVPLPMKQDAEYFANYTCVLCKLLQHNKETVH